MLKINNKKITSKIKICQSAISKGLGLMFSKKIHDISWIFIFDKEQKIPLHMMFVFYPIDVIFANKKKEIIEIKRNFKPFSIYNPKKNAKYVIELPIGKKYKLGDKISF
ncbi:MAG: DUF192 domain-containing protein [Nanoarchaeota archaeon]|nr:DUF192 domain-containing protein [Nanoarchaeota archaeon]